jgi:heme/copper-type cytochrome/quinol oxidase subunit 1
MSLRSRTISLTAPLLFGLGGILMIGAGAAAHMLSPIQDLDLAGTVYEEAEFTFVAYGLVIGAMGAVVYWAPKWSGRAMAGGPSVLLALGAIGATVLASVPYLIAGFNNQVGIWGAEDVSELVTDIDNDAAPELMNTLVAVGHALMALTVLAFLALAVVSLAKGRRVGDDPWDGHTLEWATSSPAPRDNFVDLPVVHSPEPLLDLKRSRSEA